MQVNYIIRGRKNADDKSSKKVKKIFNSFAYVSCIIFILYMFTFANQPDCIQAVSKNEDSILDNFSHISIEVDDDINITCVDIQETVSYVKCKVPEKDTTFKAFMDYRKITDKTSKQYELQQRAYTDEQGLRKIDNRYCVALGTYYADECGEIFKVTLSTGKTFEIIVSDIKKDKHTDKDNIYTPMKNGNANLLEFIIDSDKLPEDVKTVYGDISKLGFEGNIIAIEKILTNEKRSSIEED